MRKTPCQKMSINGFFRISDKHTARVRKYIPPLRGVYVYFLTHMRNPLPLTTGSGYFLTKQ